MKFPRRIAEPPRFNEPVSSSFALVSLVAPFALGKGAALIREGRPAAKVNTILKDACPTAAIQPLDPLI
jgi:hypothetical protein